MYGTAGGVLNSLLGKIVCFGWGGRGVGVAGRLHVFIVAFVLLAFTTICGPFDRGATASALEHTVAVFDASVQDIETLQAALPKGTRSIIVPQGIDGVEYLGQALQGERGITALHLFTHGAEGELVLGRSVLTTETMSGRYQSALRSLRGHFATNAVALAYGCDFAAGTEGARAVSTLSSLMNVTVAASTDKTGATGLGANWRLEVSTGPVQVAAITAPAWNHALTVTITTTTNPTTLTNAIAAGSSGITIIGTPTITTSANTTFAGTFTTSGSALGIASGMVLSTGNVSLIPGTPIGSANLSAAGTGVTAGTTEFDVATLTFTFTPNPGVTKLSIASVFASEEYNEYVNTAYTDNFSMVLNGGAYTNLNIATIPGTSIGTDINTVNNGANAGYYRDNTSTTSPPITDIKFDGATTVFINAFNVVAGTNYTLTIRIADVGDAQYDSAVFVATSTVLNNPPALDLSAALAGTGYTATYAQNGTPVAIAATDDTILDDGTTISSATITLTNKQAGDLLTAGTLPAGISASAYNSTTGVMTLTGVATLAQYQTALRAITFSNTGTPASPDRIINVVVNDGFADSNIAVATIKMATLTVTKTAGAPTVALGASATLTDAGDTITYTYAVKNTGTVALTAAAPIDPGPKFNGFTGTGTLSAFTPATAAIAVGATQNFTATYTMSAADVVNGAGTANAVTNTATASGKEPGGQTATSGPSSAATTITSAAAFTITKTAAAPTIAAGTDPTFTDAGDTITFTYALKNTGSVALTVATVTDPGPKFNGIAGTNALSAFSPASTSLAVGATVNITATYTLSQTDVANAVGITNGVTNTAGATAKNPAGTTITATSSSAATTIIAVPKLQLTKVGVLTDNVGGTAAKADLSELVTYSYTVKNAGNVPLTGISITDLHGTPAFTVPLGAGGITSETLTIPGPFGAGASPDTTANDGVWTTLAPGATVKFTWPHTVTQAEMDHG